MLWWLWWGVGVGVGVGVGQRGVQCPWECNPAQQSPQLLAALHSTTTKEATGTNGNPWSPFSKPPAPLLEGAPRAGPFHTINSGPVTCSECLLYMEWANASLK